MPTGDAWRNDDAAISATSVPQADANVTRGRISNYDVLSLGTLRFIGAVTRYCERQQYKVCFETLSLERSGANWSSAYRNDVKSYVRKGT